jgi:hypothetical protein
MNSDGLKFVYSFHRYRYRCDNLQVHPIRDTVRKRKKFLSINIINVIVIIGAEAVSGQKNRDRMDRL